MEVAEDPPDGDLSSLPVEVVLKVIVVGELGTGKTSVIRRWVHNAFTPNYRATIGVDFALKKVEFPGSATARVQLWDIAGQERVNNMTRIYYKDASAGVVVFDQTRWHTFNAVKRWVKDIADKLKSPDGAPFPIILLANKADMPNGSFATTEALDTFCDENGFLRWFPTSAKTGMNVDEAFTFLARHAIEAGARSPTMAKLSVGASECGKIDLCGYPEEDESTRAGCCGGSFSLPCKTPSIP
eukprot:Opistho-1_new@27608